MKYLLYRIMRGNRHLKILDHIIIKMNLLIFIDKNKGIKCLDTQTFNWISYPLTLMKKNGYGSTIELLIKLDPNIIKNYIKWKKSNIDNIEVCHYMYQNNSCFKEIRFIYKNIEIIPTARCLIPWHVDYAEKSLDSILLSFALAIENIESSQANDALLFKHKIKKNDMIFKLKRYLTKIAYTKELQYNITKEDICVEFLR